MVRDGAVIMGGGFGMTGNPVHLYHALAEHPDVRNLTLISNNVGEVNLGGGRLLRNGQLKKAIGSFYTSNPEAVAAAQAGRLEVQLLPQGTLAEAIRAGGAGIGGFYTPTGAGTALAEGSETKLINGREHVFVPALRADVAFIRAWRADTAGNLVYRMTERNFNPLMATAADLVIAEVEEIVDAIPPDEVVTPGTPSSGSIRSTATRCACSATGGGTSSRPGSPAPSAAPSRRTRATSRCWAGGSSPSSGRTASSSSSSAARDADPDRSPGWATSSGDRTRVAARSAARRTIGDTSS